MRRFLRLLTIASLLVLASGVHAATYYVDFSDGADGNAGTSPVHAWKRSPGDPEATGVAAATSLAPGDRVLFRGGVVYRGRVVVAKSGSASSPITFSGDEWGDAKAVIDGSDPFRPSWTVCSSAAACGGNSNYQRIYLAPAPAGYAGFQTALFENGSFLWYSQGPNATDPFHHDEIGGFYPVPNPSSTVVQTQTSITDAGVLRQASPSAWSGAWVAGWVTGNAVELREVTGFDPPTHTLSHQSFSSPPYKDRTGRYALFNHVSLIDRPGEYAFDPVSRIIYLMTANGEHPGGNAYTRTMRETAFLAPSAASHIVIEGFAIRHFTYGIQWGSSSATNVTVRRNDISSMRAHDKYAILMNAANSMVEGNTIVDANRAVGILSSANNITIRNNFLQRTSRQGIWLMGASNSTVVGNTVADVSGSHANGISVYAGSSNIRVSGNRVIRSSSAITFERSADLHFENNVVAPDGQISDWSAMTGQVVFLNNTFPGSTLYLASAPSYTFRNNILRSAPAKGTRSHNIYTAASSGLQLGEMVVTDINGLFADAAGLDYSPRLGSRAIDAGVKVDVLADIDGNPRPTGAAWDIGAHEYAGPTLKLLPPTNLRALP